MDTFLAFKTISKQIFHWAAGMTAGLLLMGMASGSYADDPPVTMAPPIQLNSTTAANGAAANASQESVFNWMEITKNQKVPLRRAVFDQGGYQLYDKAGETIVVPFTDRNLYVMKFAQSATRDMYFVNTGDAPVLYVPKNGCLENASVPGARWYPFSDDFHPARPVFIGIAPSWTDYYAMGWYPDMVIHGCYWGSASYLSGGVFSPSSRLTFVIGGHSCYGWIPYQHYYFDHPAPYRVTIIDPNIYRFDARPGGSFHGSEHTVGISGEHQIWVHRTASSGSHSSSSDHSVRGGGFSHGGSSSHSGGSFGGRGRR